MQKFSLEYLEAMPFSRDNVIMSVVIYEYQQLNVEVQGFKHLHSQMNIYFYLSDYNDSNLTELN